MLLLIGRCAAVGVVTLTPPRRPVLCLSGGSVVGRFVKRCDLSLFLLSGFSEINAEICRLCFLWIYSEHL